MIWSFILITTNTTVTSFTHNSSKDFQSLSAAIKLSQDIDTAAQIQNIDVFLPIISTCKASRVEVTGAQIIWLREVRWAENDRKSAMSSVGKVTGAYISIQTRRCL